MSFEVSDVHEESVGFERMVSDSNRKPSRDYHFLSYIHTHLQIYSFYQNSLQYNGIISYIAAESVL